MPQNDVKWLFDLMLQEGDEPRPPAQHKSFSADVRMVDGNPVGIREKTWPEYNAYGAAWTWKVHSLVVDRRTVSIHKLGSGLTTTGKA